MDAPDADANAKASAHTAGSPAARERTVRRVVATALLALVIGTGLAVHALLPDTAASDIAGDALYATAAYLAVVLVAPGLRPVVVGAIAAAWCVAVEVFQLTGIPLELGTALPPAMLALGTVFDPRDLAVYLVTIALMALLDALQRVLAARAPR